ncbi:MAG TPA: ATP-binding protein [Saprospiraceae bacterium]|nr:ATP-binding protein [Saprospiraceae bacterium]
MELIGREDEQKTFKHCLHASESKLVAVYGRRRIGKTFLIRKYFGNKIFFEVAGLYNGEMKDQLLHFTKTLAKSGYYPAAVASPNNWFAAFDLLALHIDAQKDNKKKVIFIDELPWFDTPRSKFLTAFESFWNSYCSKRNDLLVVICGSAASWMVNKILKNKGGLHNRVSEKIQLKTFLTNKKILFKK